jgi:hypothetical protein
MAAARNLPRDWRARDSAAPAADSIRQISWTTYFWPTARILLPAHDNAAPPLCDQPSPAHGRNGLNRVASLLGRSAMGQAGLWINALQCEVNMPHAALVVAKTGAKTGAKTRAKDSGQDTAQDSGQDIVVSCSAAAAQVERSPLDQSRQDFEVLPEWRVLRCVE